jgi:hypothetical protein
LKHLFLLFLCIVYPIWAQTVKVTDYKVPVSEAKTLRFDGSWNFAQSENTVLSNNAGGNLFYRTFYSSLPLAWFIDVDAVGTKNFNDYTHNVNLDASFRKYVWEGRNWFGFARINASHATGYNQVASDLTTGGGYGRYINATPLAKAVRIEEHLRRDKILRGNLPPDIMIRIANVIEREDEFLDTYGDSYRPYWYDAIENEIQKSEMLEGESVGSMGILRMQQVLEGITERVNQRYYGWDATIGVLFPMTTPYDSVYPGEPNLVIGERHSFPISWQIQINTTAELFTPMNESFAKEINSRLGLDFIFELSNRINFISGYRLGINKPSNTSSLINHRLTASFWYYLENNINFTFTTELSKFQNNPRLITSRVGFQYNLF